MIVARSGHAKDIQDAVDEAVAEYETDVGIPDGLFDFYEVEETWEDVEVPTGIENILGALTERTSGQPEVEYGMSPNNQVVDWRTVLRMPWDVPSEVDVYYPKWFSVAEGSKFRLSDLKLVGYRSIDPDSKYGSVAAQMNYRKNFRIDHCCLEHICEGLGFWNCSGVIDHCRIYNIYGYDDLADYHNSDVGYGVELHRDWIVDFEPTMDVLGKYKGYSVFIEDSYLSKWRHCVASGHGAHYVFRRNLIDQDLGHFSLDAHGLRDAEAGRGGTRCAEYYENVLTNCDHTDDLWNIIQNGGGCGVWFNNYIDTSYHPWGITLYPEDYIPSEVWHLKDFYLWSRKGPWVPNWDGVPDGFTADRNVLADWNRPAYNRDDPRYPNVDPSWSIAGYKPYPYPHPLTITKAILSVASSPVIGVPVTLDDILVGNTPASVEVVVGDHVVSVPKDVEV